MPRFCTTGAASAAAFRAKRIIRPHRQTIVPVTITAGPGVGGIANITVADGNLCNSPQLGNETSGGGISLIAAYDFGRAKLLRDCQIIGVQGYDYFGSGNTVGVDCHIYSEAGFEFSTVLLGGASSAVRTLNRTSRFLYLYAVGIGGYGSDPAGSYFTQAYFDCLDVTGEV